MVELRALGTAELRVDGAPLSIQPKRLALLAWLAIARPRGFHRRDILVSLFWPESDDRHARNSLSQALHGLRRAIGAAAIETRGREGVRLAIDALSCDAVRFERDVEEGRHAEALATWNGELLDGLHVTGPSGFERWLEVERVRLRRRASDAARFLADAAEAVGDPASVVRWLQRGLEIPPQDETDVRRLIGALNALGDRASALRTYEEFERYLAIEYETTPSEETRALARAVRTGTGSASLQGDASVARSTPADGLAVLPLQNLTGDDGQEYFADGMTEMLITELARSRSLRVVSRQSTSAFKGSRLRLAEIAHRLGVDLLVEGSVLRAGHRVRIAAQLVRAEPEAHLWADAFDGELGDILALQQAVARGIAQAIGETLSPRPDSSIAAPQSIDERAVDEFIRGVVRLPLMNPANRSEIIGYFERAVEYDNSFAEAWAFLAHAWTNSAYLGLIPRDRAAPRALAASERAVALMPFLGSVHAVRATVLQSFTYDWAAVKAALAKASELGGGDIRGYAVNATYITSRGGFDEGIRRAEEAIRYNPLGSPEHFLLGWVLFRARRYGRAIEQLAWTVSQWPYLTWASAFLAASQTFADRSAEAIETCRLALSSQVDPTSLAYIAATLGRAGAMGEAREAVQRLMEIDRTAWLDPYPLAVAHAGVGDAGAMLAALERVVGDGSVQAWVLPVEVFFDPYRSDPRFERIVAALDLPEVEPPAEE